MLVKAMYGPPGSPRIWGLWYAESLRRLGFAEAQLNSCAWIMKDKDNSLKHTLTVYVDDVVLPSGYKSAATSML